MKIKITQLIENDIFGKFKALYLEDKSITITCAKVYGGHEKATINNDEILTINNEMTKTLFIIGFIYEVEGIFEIYAKNPQMGLVLNVTKSTLCN